MIGLVVIAFFNDKVVFLANCFAKQFASLWNALIKRELFQPFYIFFFYIFSSMTLTVPPQTMPSSSAASLVISTSTKAKLSSSFPSILLPLAMTLPSMHPPPMVPTMLPSFLMSIFVPASLGAEPFLEIMVAITISSLSSASILSNISLPNPPTPLLLLTSIISAITATDISSGVSAPILSPMGMWIASRTSLSTPSFSSSSHFHFNICELNFKS